MTCDKEERMNQLINRINVFSQIFDSDKNSDTMDAIDYFLRSAEVAFELGDKSKRGGMTWRRRS